MRQLKITQQITVRDSQSLSSYLTEVSNIPMLTSKEESELSKIIQETGDRKAIDKLVTANLRFVISVAKQYNSRAPLIDLIQEGNAGLIKAAERFDETRGFKFISYAVWWIRQSIMQYLSENQRKIRLPLNKVGALGKIKQATSELEQLLERKPTNNEIADYLIDSESRKPNGDPSRFTAKKIEEMLIQSDSVSSLDAPFSQDDGAGTMADITPGESYNDIDSVLKGNDLQIELKRVLDKYPDREKEAIILYFGLFGREQKSLEEIGIKFDLTRERVRQIKEKVLRSLRNRSNNSTLKEYR